MSDLYEQDFIGWTEQQARILREAAQVGSNLGLDWANLIEEVESLGRSQLRALGSQIRRIILHLLKLEHSPAIAPAAGWAESIASARAEVAGLLDDDPGLKPRLAEVICRESPRALTEAIASLVAYGLDPAPLHARKHAGTVYTAEQILGDWLPERPRQT